MPDLLDPDTFVGTDKNGMEIKIIVDTNGKIRSAYPLKLNK
jgi:hypothetical protein